MLLIDNLAAFYCMDRPLQSIPARGSSSGGKGVPITMSAVHAAAAAHVKDFMRGHRALLLATKWAPSDTRRKASEDGQEGEAASSSASLWAPRDLVPFHWQAVLTHRVVLARKPSASCEPSSTRILARWQVPPGEHATELHVRDDGTLPREANQL
mmetsp:Transcript_22539/g.53939  ORF Transcript_22539/g.53939 Transcript_22539/m.53939 type:complete len:155 (+) Transcript_22539:414-878(+)